MRIATFTEFTRVKINKPRSWWKVLEDVEYLRSIYYEGRTPGIRGLYRER